jgi:hypothetical protein
VQTCKEDTSEITAQAEGKPQFFHQQILLLSEIGARGCQPHQGANTKLCLFNCTSNFVTVAACFDFTDK